MNSLPIAGILTPLAFLRRMLESGHWVGWESCRCNRPAKPHATLIWPKENPWFTAFLDASVSWQGDFIACVQEHSKAQIPRQ